MDRYDVAVVGAGLVGLTAAATAARRGASVVVIDRQSELGGRARTSEHDGALFNQGAHALYRTGAGMKTLSSLGISPRGVAPSLDNAQALLNGRVAALPRNVGGVLRTKLLSPPAKASFAKAMTALQRAHPDQLHNITFERWVETITDNADVRNVVLALSRLSTYAHGAHMLSAGIAVDQMQRGQDGVLYLHGGWRQLVDALARAASSSGATLLGGVAVASVTPTDDGWAISAADEGWSARSVVIAGLSPQMTAELAGLDAGTFSHAGPPAEAAVFDLSLRRPPPTTFILGVDTPTYFSVHGPPAELTGSGRAAAVAMKYLPIGGSTNMGADKAELEALVSLADADVSSSRFLRRMTVTHGIPLASQGGLDGRPRVSVDGSDGLFVAGDWVGGEGMFGRRLLGQRRGIGPVSRRACGRHVRRCRALSEDAVLDVFEAERSRLFGLAYRMLGTIADADDIVQETWLRWNEATEIERPHAWLTTVASRIAVDRLRSAQRRRETYVGPGCPNPSSPTETTRLTSSSSTSH